MYKVSVYNILFDIRDFIRCNIGKFIIIALINIAAIVFGIKSGLSVDSAGGYLLAHPTNDFLLAMQERGILAHLFLNIFFSLVYLTLLTLISINFLLSYLCFALLFFRAYSFAMNVCLYICLFKLTVLPFVMFCILPLFILNTFIFSVVAVMSFNRAQELRKFGCGRNNNFGNYAFRMIIPCTMSVIVCIVIAVPSYFLTIGIIL